MARKSYKNSRAGATQRCSSCGQVKGSAAFRKWHGGYVKTCATCRAVPQSVVFRNHRFALLKRAGRYYKINLTQSGLVTSPFSDEQKELMRVRARILQTYYNGGYRAKKLGLHTTLTVLEWVAILNNSKGRCVYCKSFVGIENLGMDHIKPLSRNGAHTARNVTASCFPCNSRKGDGSVASLQRKSEKSLRQ